VSAARRSCTAGRTSCGAAIPTSGAVLLERTIQQSDYLILGLLTNDKTIVGHYFFAFNQSVVVASIFVQSLVRVLLSGLSALRDNVKRQVEVFLEATRLLGVLAIPLGVLQATLARPILTLLFGDRWAPAIPLLELLSVVAAFAVGSWPAISLIMAQGRYRTRFWLRVWATLAFVVTTLTAGLIGLRFDAAAVGLAIGVSVFRVIYGPIAVWVACRLSPQPMTAIIAIFLWPLLGALLTILPVAAGTRLLLDAAELSGLWYNLLHLLISPLPGLALYWVWCKLVLPGELRSARDQLDRVAPAKVMQRIPRWVF
jgi:O-antigen/teichoic acid export membrane protein